MVTRAKQLLAAAFSIFGQNWVTVFGATLAGVSAFLIVAAMLLGLLGLTTSPYIGIMAFLVLPGVFVLGLLIIPLGAWLGRRRPLLNGQAGVPALGLFPVIDFNIPRVRHIVIVVALLTVVNLAIIGTATYSGVLFMDSVTFCGRVCHTVMKPEFTAHSGSPHSHVACVDCHIGPGAPWFVRSKISGLGQVLAVTFDTYPQPIPTPVENLRPARETCEECHWPSRFSGDRIRVRTSYRDDEANTPVKTVLVMHVGGAASARGIHSWHIDPNRHVTYWPTNEKRMEFAKVTVADAAGNITAEYVNPNVPTEKVGHEPPRVMDCIDCHNRPTHIFESPEQGIANAITAGLVDRSIPYIHQVALEALKEAKGEPGDLDRIATRIGDFYKEKYPNLPAEKIDAAINGIQAVYNRNVFPEMNVTWGTYPNHIGHTETPGCFRCHGTLQNADGKTISDDCEVCHAIPAQEEENPEILKLLGS